MRLAKKHWNLSTRLANPPARMRDNHRAAGILSGVLALAVAFNVQAFASTPPAQPLLKQGSCPSGYSQSGNYCNPGSNARYAVQKEGSCPSGYSQNGDYCLAGPNAKLAVPKRGSCPSGYSQSGDYCLSSR